MKKPPLHSTILRSLLLFVLFASSLQGQTIQQKDKDKNKVQIRILCKKPVPGSMDLSLYQGGELRHELEITRGMVGKPIPVDRGELIFTRTGETPPAETVDFMPTPILKLTIPSSGKNFVLALFAHPKPTPEKPYLYKLVNTDDLNFGISDLYLFNLTPVAVGGIIGKKKFVLPSGSSELVRPQPEEEGSRMYQAKFFYDQEGKARQFNSTRWPTSKVSRIYIFFVPDYERRTIGYHTFREYQPFPN